MAERIEDTDLWERFTENRDSVQAVADLIEAWMPLVHRILRRLMIRLPPHVAVEDLLQVAVIGLYEALDRFDPGRGARFETFASRRIRGAVIDELRSNDHLSRGDRARVKELERAAAEWAGIHGEAPDEERLAELMQMSRSELASLLERAHVWLSLDREIDVNGNGDTVLLREALADDSSPRPDECALKEDTLRLLRAEFRKLSRREQKILYLYYFEDLRLSEISVLFDVSEARVCQIHGIIIAKLKAGLRRAGLQNAA